MYQVSFRQILASLREPIVWLTVFAPDGELVANAARTPS